MKLTQGRGIQNQTEIEGVKWQTQLLSNNLEAMLNNGLIFQDNFRMQVIGATFLAANINTTFPHNLNAVPLGYLVIGRSAAITVYDGSQNVLTKTSVTLKASGTGAATIMIF